MVHDIASSHLSRPHADAPLGAERRSDALEQILRVQREESFDRRVTRHWTGRAPRVQRWELEAGAARAVLSVIHRFIAAAPLSAHGVLGPDRAAPSFLTLRTGTGSIEAPADAIYFIEDADAGERFTLAVEQTTPGCFSIAVDARRPSERIDALRACATEHNYLRGRAFTLDGSIVDLDAATPDSVILTDAQRQAIDLHILRFAQRFESLRTRSARLSRGVLLEGVPGCGKSILLRSLIPQLPGFSACIATPAGMAEGEAVRTLAQLIRMTAPCAIVLEEIDLFATDRIFGGGPDMGELMQLMDGLAHIPGVLWLATTNRAEKVEEALADRPGRFDRRIVFGPLDDATRGRLLDRLIRPQSLTPAARDLALARSSGWTGAQVRELCETLRLADDEDAFDVPQVRAALADCGFQRDAGFGFAAGLADHA